MLDATIQAGAKEAHLIAEPLAAAIGANVPISSPSGNMIVDIGGGTSEAAVISLNDIVVSKSLRIGGNKIDEMIPTYVRRKYNLVIGDRTAEDIKVPIGSALPLEQGARSRSAAATRSTACPRRADELQRGHRGDLRRAASDRRQTKEVLEKTPPELAADVADKA